MSDKIKRLLRKSNRKEHGFTLIEVIVGLAILSIIAVGIYSALHASVNSSVSEDERATAKNLAEAQMEYVKAYIIDPNDWDWETGYTKDYVASNAIMVEYPGYEANIVWANTDRGINLQLIIVTVKYEGEEAWVLEGKKLITADTFSYS